MKSLLLLLSISALLFGSLAFADNHDEKKSATEMQQPYEPEIIHSGFLGDYSDFKVINNKTKAEVWLKPGFDDFSMLKKYKTIHLVPTEIWLAPKDAAYQGINPDELKNITDYFHLVLHEHLDRKYTFVKVAGPETMTLRIAITNIKRTKPHRDWYDFIPIKLVADGGTALARKVTGKTLNVYQASLELEALDSLTGERLVAAVDTHESHNLKQSKDEDKWRGITEVLDFWAATIRDRIDEGHK